VDAELVVVGFGVTDAGADCRIQAVLGFLDRIPR
jgi:hypothetical protein